MRPSQLSANIDPDPNDTTDSILLARIGQRDRQALASLYDRYSPIIYALALRMNADSAVAEDIVVDVFCELWQSVDRFQGHCHVVAALLAATRRRTRPPVHAQCPALAEAQHLPSCMSPRAYLDCVAQAHALVPLPPEQREVIELSYYDRLTLAEIAARLDMPVSIVKMHMRQGLLALHGQLFAPKKEP